MRAILSLPLLLLVTATPAAQAQEKNPIEKFGEWLGTLGKPAAPPKPPEPSSWNTVTLNPLALQQEQLGIEYERVLGAPATLYVAPQAVFGAAGRSWILSAGLNVGVRFFVLGTAPNGLFIGPEVGANYQRSSQQGVIRTALGLGFGAVRPLGGVLRPVPQRPGHREPGAGHGAHPLHPAPPARLRSRLLMGRYLQ